MPRVEIGVTVFHISIVSGKSCFAVWHDVPCRVVPCHVHGRVLLCRVISGDVSCRAMSTACLAMPRATSTMSTAPGTMFGKLPFEKFRDVQGQKVSLAFGIALEADLPTVSVMSDGDPRTSLTSSFASFF